MLPSAEGAGGEGESRNEYTVYILHGAGIDKKGPHIHMKNKKVI